MECWWSVETSGCHRSCIRRARLRGRQIAQDRCSTFLAVSSLSNLGSRPRRPEVTCGPQTGEHCRGYVRWAVTCFWAVRRPIRGHVASLPRVAAPELASEHRGPEHRPAVPARSYWYLTGSVAYRRSKAGRNGRRGPHPVSQIWIRPPGRSTRGTVHSQASMKERLVFRCQDRQEGVAMTESKIELTEPLRREARWTEASKLKDETVKRLRAAWRERRSARTLGRK